MKGTAIDVTNLKLFKFINCQIIWCKDAIKYDLKPSSSDITGQELTVVDI